jgi:hypothetical protein
LLVLLLLWQLSKQPRAARLLQATAETYLLWRKGRAYRAALDRGDSDSCLAFLYWRLSRDGHYQRLEEAFSDASQQVALRELLAHAYGKGEPPSRIDAAKALWKALARPASQRQGRARFEMNPRRLPLRQSPDRQ